MLPAKLIGWVTHPAPSKHSSAPLGAARLSGAIDEPAKIMWLRAIVREMQDGKGLDIHGLSKVFLPNLHGIKPGVRPF